MKKMRKHWLVWTSKVLSTVIALLGLAGCGSCKRLVDPPVVMYGTPYDGPVVPDTTIRRSPGDGHEIRLMYGVPPARYEKVEQGPSEGTK
jgi:hypothetical protein